MPRNYSARFRENINSTGADQTPKHLLEITHPGLTEPVRIVNDNADMTSNGALFVGMGFSLVLPDDPEDGQGSASLAIDNIGKELTEWIDASNGGRGARARIMQVLPSHPDIIEWEVTLDLTGVHIDPGAVSGTLTHEDLINQPSVMVYYRPEVAPGLF